jgi:DMSO/TMAO reductase YedYZ molybdopterin-dependent catalytic subunit
LTPEKNNTILPPGQNSVAKLLRWGEDHPTISRAAPKIDLNKWTLTVAGKVRKPVELRWQELLGLPKVESTSDFHCVEGWSVLDLIWEGIRFQEIIRLVEPKVEAEFTTFECADGFTTSLSIKTLMGDHVILAYQVNGRYLEIGTGAPLRLIVPGKYAYKNAMWITKILFTSQKQNGYWESRGYSDTADVWKNDRYSR